MSVGLSLVVGSTSKREKFLKNICKERGLTYVFKLIDSVPYQFLFSLKSSISVIPSPQSGYYSGALQPTSFLESPETSHLSSPVCIRGLGRSSVHEVSTCKSRKPRIHRKGNKTSTLFDLQNKYWSSDGFTV